MYQKKIKLREPSDEMKVHYGSTNDQIVICGSFMCARGLIFLTSHNFKEPVKPIYTIKFYDHIKHKKQILQEYAHVNWP